LKNHGNVIKSHKTAKKTFSFISQFIYESLYYSPANIMPIACALSRGIDDLSAVNSESSDCAGLIARSPIIEIK
jgi:hypothetical protein